MTLTVPEIIGVLALVLAAARFITWRIDRLDEKNEKAHAAITENVKTVKDDLGAKIDGVARDVAFLAGRQAERDQQSRAR